MPDKRKVKQPDFSLEQAAHRRLDNLTKPQGSLGMLEKLATRIVVITGKERPVVARKAVFVFAADHGVASRGVSAYPQEVTAQMVLNFLAGGAGINVLARTAQAKVVIVDAGVKAGLPAHPELKAGKIAHGTADITQGPAMSRAQAEQSLDLGARVFEEEYARGLDLAAAGEMGIGNTTASSAIVSVFTGASPEETTGRGTGVPDESLMKKTSAVREALALNRPNPADALDVLAKVGGFEIGAMAGLYIAAAARRVPVLLDGFISAAAALIACALEPETRHYLIATHLSAEKGHRMALEHLGQKPLFAFDLRLGEGTGATLAMPTVEAAVRIYNEMATFEQAGVSKG